MDGTISGQDFGNIILALITIIGTLLGVYFGYRLNRHQQPKFQVKTFSFNKALNDLKDIMEDVHLQFSLTHTLLIEPTIPPGMNYSKRHSHTNNGYFDFLITNRRRKFLFKYWDGSDKKRTVKIAVDGNQLTAEIFMLPHEIRDLVEILKNQL
jgi:hypothetical protein